MYAFLHGMDLWERIYDDTCSSRIEKFLYQNSSFLDDWCMRVSGAKRRRTNKTNQLMKDYAKNVDFRVCIEDYQVADDEKSKSEARDFLRSYLTDYCYDYLVLYAKEEAGGIWMEESNWVYEWIQRSIPLIEKIQLDEITIQTAKIEQSLNEIFSLQYRKIDTEESNLEFTDDAGRKVCFFSDGKITSLDLPVRTSNSVFFIESPKPIWLNLKIQVKRSCFLS